jgi:simple sugar transport system permease protein
MTDHSLRVDEPVDAALSTSWVTGDDAVVEPTAGEPMSRLAAALGNVASAVVSVILALIIGAILIILTDKTATTAWSSFFIAPGHALSASWNAVWHPYQVLVSGSFGSLYAISETLTRAAPLMLMGLSVSMAFRAGLFNIGGQAQFLAGTLASVWVAFSLPTAPGALVLILACSAGAAGGGIVGFVPGFLKARSGAHEVITTLMLNAIMVYFVTWILATSTFQQPGQSAPLSKPAPVELPRILGDANRANIGIIVAVAAAIAAWWILKRTTVGFTIRTVGANRVAAHYAGMSLGRTFVGVMAATGALAGLAGAIELLGVQHSVFPGIDGTYLVGGIAVALLGRTQPLGVILASLLFGAMQAGGLAMQAQTGVSSDIVSVVQALVIVFVAVPALMQRLVRSRYRIGAPQQLSKGWGG